MNSQVCSWEAKIIEHVRNGNSDANVDAHLSICEECRVIPATTRALAEVARDGLTMVLPDPGLLWLRAQLVSRQERERRLLQPLTIAQRVAWFGVTMCWAAIFTLKWPVILGWITNLDGEAVLETLIAAGRSPSQSLVVLGLLAATAVLTVHGVFAEE